MVLQLIREPEKRFSALTAASAAFARVRDVPRAMEVMQTALRSTAEPQEFENFERAVGEFVRIGQTGFIVRALGDIRSQARYSAPA